MEETATTAGEPEHLFLGRYRISMETLLRLVIVGVLLDTLIAVVLIAITVISIQASNRADKASSEANVAKIAAYQSCLSGNIFRADNEQLWLNVVHLIPASTPAGKAFLQSVLADVQKTDAPRTCTLGGN